MTAIGQPGDYFGARGTSSIISRRLGVELKPTHIEVRISPRLRCLKPAPASTNRLSGLLLLSATDAFQSIRVNVGEPSVERLAVDESLRERATTAREFDPAEIMRVKSSAMPLAFLPAASPLVTVVSVNLAMSMFLLPRLDTSFLSEIRWGETLLAAIGRGSGP